MDRILLIIFLVEFILFEFFEESTRIFKTDFEFELHIYCSYEIKFIIIMHGQVGFLLGLGVFR